MDIDVNSVLKCPSRMANEEFFDAEEGANLAREDDSDDFLKQLEAAIGAEDPPSPKHGNSKDDIAMTLENGLTKSFGELNGLDSAGIDSNQTIESKIIPLAGIDEKLENDLLKDLDEDNNEDLDTVCEEVKNLLESAIADSETLKQETVSNKDLAPENNEEKRISEGDEKNENKAEDKLPQTNGNDNQTSENSVVDPVDNSSVSLEDIAKEPSGNKEIESKNDDLLVACSSPIESTKVICENSSETSSNDTPGDSSDSEKQANMNGNNETSEDTETQLRSKESSDTEAQENGKDESVEIERQPTMGELLAPASGDDDEMQLCMIADAESETKEPEEIVTPESSSPKPSVPLKLPFMRSFSNAVGKLSRIDLEQLLIEKITESIMFCSENTNIRARLEKQEKITEAYKKRLDNAKKQYNDLEMIHSRVMKDLRDRPDAPITPVKITRAVGLQVYQPQPRSKFTPPSTTLMPPTKTLKRPIESETVVNGTGVSPESKKKKTMKTTPLRPMLSDQQRKSLELEEAKVEQNMRNNVIGSISPAATPSNASSAPLSGATRKSVNAQSIDLTDDGEEAKSTAQHGNQQVHQPPALVAIRGNQAQQPIKKKFVIHPSQSPTRNKFPQQRIDSRVRCHPAPLPNTPPQITRPGMKKIPPRPNIKINNANLGIVVSWTIECLTIEHTEIHSYQIYAYEVTINPPAVDNWRHVGDVKALLLPMAVTLTQFQEGQKYFFAVRAVDVHKRLGPFSLPKSWAEK